MSVAALGTNTPRLWSILGLVVLAGCGGGEGSSNPSGGSSYTISGKVTLSAAPISGVTVTLGGSRAGATTTDAAGQYAFSGLASGSYTVTPSLARQTFTGSTAVTVSGADRSSVDFTQDTYRLSGSVSGAATAGVTVTLSGAGSAAATTDATGQYSFPGLVGGSYTVTASLPGYQFCRLGGLSFPAPLEGANLVNVDIGAYALGPYSISGTITVQGVASAGADVTLTVDGCTLSQVTAGNGAYAFGNLAGRTFYEWAAFAPAHHWVYSSIFVDAANVTRDFNYAF